MKGLGEVYGKLYFLRYGKESGYSFTRVEAEAARQ
ncbi:hypothetical protein J2S00_000932 [Caldalkalibacillus uzonensis]|uniref:Uncharacterized protein n=1 Tax=Caldalkalibacillus uzonensis TaxID=353224 RepID=A0ABU0CPX3_9BACI|nr:hypothetical protein [Caldalkalibacillus uzonensis]